MWSGRFREPLDRAFEQWQRSFPFDWRLLPFEVAASKAHAQTIAAANILTTEELTQTLEGLDRVAQRTESWAHRISATSGQIDYETSNAQIGAELYLSEDTVKTHARRLFRKLGANDRAQAVAIGLRRGLIQ